MVAPLSRFDLATEALARLVARHCLGYDAVDSRGRRKAAGGTLQSEDNLLLPAARRRLVDSIYDKPPSSQVPMLRGPFLFFP
jgi:hypothetical protein